jgi:hypothetical protein
MIRGKTLAAVLVIFALGPLRSAAGQMRAPDPHSAPTVDDDGRSRATTAETSATPAAPRSKEKLARVWANEPPLVRLARDKFGAELTEIDAKFFTAVAASDWADLRPSDDTTYDAEEPSSWAASPTLKADRIAWLCTDPAAMKLVPSRGVWVRGANVAGNVDLYRCNIPFSLTFYDCLLGDGINISHAKLQELDIRNCCSAAVQARGVQIAENVYLLKTSVFGGLDLIDSQIGGDFDFSGGLAFHGRTPEDVSKPGVSLNFHDAKVAGDLKLGDKFRALGQVRLIGTQIGRSLTCSGGKFSGAGELAIDARRSQIGGNAGFTSGFRADGGVEIRRARIGGDLDCDGARIVNAKDDALDADLVAVGGQILIGDGFHAEGEVRLINATVGGDIDADNGHFLHPDGDALSLDGATIGRSLRIGADSSSPTDETADITTGFLSRGTVRLWGTQVNQDILASGGQFEAPAGAAILACNMRVASRVVLSGVEAKGTVNLFSADIEHELDLRGSTFDGHEAFNKIALWANGMHVRGHVYCNQVDAADRVYKLKANGLCSFQFATISMHWDLHGAELTNSDGDALDASDCRVGGYVNLDSVAIDGRASFSRAKIDGMWILNKSVSPEKMRLDMRFAHIWVIKDEKLEDWPPAGQLQLEGLVYDHFDDDSPLDVNARLAWLRRQYTPAKRRYGSHSEVQVRPGSSDHPETTDGRSSHSMETLGQTSVQGQETRSQLAATRPQPAHRKYPSDGVIPAEFETPSASMPAPMTAAPMPVPDPSYPMMAPPIGPDGGSDRNGSSIAPMPMPAEVAPSAISSGENTAIPGAPVVAVPPNAEPTVKSDGANTTASVPTAAVDTDPAARRYITQPYTQLAAVYRAIGQDEQASTVLVARAERIGELAPAFSAQGLWYRYLGRLIGYGYEPFRAIKIGLVIIALGAVIFAIGGHRNLMAETKLAERVLSQEGEAGVVSPTYPRFNAIVYSLDVFLPFVDLNQVCYWIPGEKPGKPRKSRNCLMHLGPYSLKVSGLLHCYLWFQTLAGWTLCTLLAAAVTGIVQS